MALAPPTNFTLPQITIVAEAFMRKGAKSLHARAWDVSNCRRLDRKNGVCVYTITLPKSKSNPAETCVGELFVRRGPKGLLYRVQAVGCSRKVT